MNNKTIINQKYKYMCVMKAKGINKTIYTNDRNYLVNTINILMLKYNEYIIYNIED